MTVGCFGGKVLSLHFLLAAPQFMCISTTGAGGGTFCLFPSICSDETCVIAIWHSLQDGNTRFSALISGLLFYEFVLIEPGGEKWPIPGVEDIITVVNDVVNEI